MHHWISVLQLLMHSTCTSPHDDRQPVTTVTQSDFKTPRSHGSKLTASVWSCDTWSSRDVCSNPSCRLTYREHQTPSSTLNLICLPLLINLRRSHGSLKAFYSHGQTTKPSPPFWRHDRSCSRQSPRSCQPHKTGSHKTTVTRRAQNEKKRKRKISTFSCPGVTLKIWKTFSR